MLMVWLPLLFASSALATEYNTDGSVYMNGDQDEHGYKNKHGHKGKHGHKRKHRDHGDNGEQGEQGKIGPEGPAGSDPNTLLVLMSKSVNYNQGLRRLKLAGTAV